MKAALVGPANFDQANSIIIYREYIDLSPDTVFYSGETLIDAQMQTPCLVACQVSAALQGC
jgi:hypothetical protein